MSEFGRKLRYAREAKGLSQADLAGKTGVSERSIGNYERGERVPDANFLALLLQAGFDVTGLLGGHQVSGPDEGRADSLQGEDRWEAFVQVLRYDIRASAGPGALIDGEHVLDQMAFRRDWLRGTLGLQLDRLALLNVDGDSMAPTLTHGDMILVDTRPADGLRPGVYVINLDGRLLVKRLQPAMNGSVKVVSDNERYSSEVVEGDDLRQLQVVGQVVWQGRRI